MKKKKKLPGLLNSFVRRKSFISLLSTIIADHQRLRWPKQETQKRDRLPFPPASLFSSSLLLLHLFF